MTITFSQSDYWQQFDLAGAGSLSEPDAGSICAFPARLGQGYHRSVSLSDGIDLDIEDYCLDDDVVVMSGDRPHPIEYIFEQVSIAGKSYQRYALCGSGLAPKERWHRAGEERIVSVNVHIEPALFRQWIGDTDALPVALKPLLRSPDQKYFTQSGTPSAAMQAAFQQILNCPYQGLTRRLYLESKLWEMMALILDDVASENAPPPPAQLLNAADVERIHYAGEILRSRLSDPPSLMGLARLVQINDHKLKVGFRQVFGTTVFGYLHDCRMEQSRQLLEAGEVAVAGAAQSVGFANRSHFAIAFRKKFGMNPSQYRKCRKQAAFQVG